MIYNIDAQYYIFNNMMWISSPSLIVLQSTPFLILYLSKLFLDRHTSHTFPIIPLASCASFQYLLISYSPFVLLSLDPCLNFSLRKHGYHIKVWGYKIIKYPCHLILGFVFFIHSPILLPPPPTHTQQRISYHFNHCGY